MRLCGLSGARAESFSARKNLLLTKWRDVVDKSHQMVLSGKEVRYGSGHLTDERDR